LVDVLVDLQVVDDVDALDHDHPVVCGLDLTGRLTDQSAFMCGDLTRLQRASKRAGQSAGSGGDHIVECRGAFRLTPWCDAVVLGHAGVHSEHHRFLNGGDLGASERAADPLDPHVRRVYDFTHGQHRR